MKRFIERALDVLFPPHEDVIRARAVREEKALSLLSIRAVHGSTVYAALPYANVSVRALIRANKYYNDTHSAEVLGSVLYEMLEVLREERALDPQWEHPLVVPIPTSPDRARSRGAHQVKNIMRALLSEHRDALEYADVLKRVARPSQTKVQKHKRYKNIRGAFSIPKRFHARVLGRSVIIVDDITESGATMKDAMRAIREAGAKHVVGVALAK